MKTYNAKKNEVVRKWYIIDLDGKVLGRAATQIATVLRGKNKPQFTPHVDAGDFIVAINAAKVKMTGSKWDQKEYHRHTGYPGGIKSVTASKLVKTKPEIIIREAVKGMLPKSILGRGLLHKLKIYAGSEHPHVAQKPENLV